MSRGLDARRMMVVAALVGWPVDGLRASEPEITNPPPGWIVTFRTGESLTLRDWSLLEGELRGESILGAARVPLAAVESVKRPVNGRIRVEDDFDANLPGEYSRERLVKTPVRTAPQSLAIGPPGLAASWRVNPPLLAGRLELWFHDDAVIRPRRRWQVELVGDADAAAVAIELGAERASYSVRVGASEIVQKGAFARRPGWHRLVVHFDKSELLVTIDGAELVGRVRKGLPSAISHARIRVFGPEGSSDAMAHVDDLVITATTATINRLAVPDQTAVIDGWGDAWHGELVSATSAEIVLRPSHGDPFRLMGRDVVEIVFPSAAAPASEWKAPFGSLTFPGGRLEVEQRQMDEEFGFHHPLLGARRLAKSQVIQWAPSSLMARRVAPLTPAHLGGKLVSGFRRPLPDGLSVDIPLKLLPGDALIEVKVRGLEGESSGGPFAELLKAGKMRTVVSLDGKAFDYLNRHAAGPSDQIQILRVRLPDVVRGGGDHILRFSQSPEEEGPTDEVEILGLAILEEANRP